jgi:hypothetical protein
MSDKQMHMLRGALLAVVVLGLYTMAHAQSLGPAIFQTFEYVVVSAGAADANKPVLLDATGKLSVTTFPAGVGVSIQDVEAADLDFTGEVVLYGNSMSVTNPTSSNHIANAGYVGSSITSHEGAANPHSVYPLKASPDTITGNWNHTGTLSALAPTAAAHVVIASHTQTLEATSASKADLSTVEASLSGHIGSAVPTGHTTALTDYDYPDRAGVRPFTGDITIPGLKVEKGAFDYTYAWNAPAAARTITVLDPGGAASPLMTRGSYSMAPGATIVYDTNGLQVANGSSGTVKLNYLGTTENVTVSFPALTGTAALLSAEQTFALTQTFTSGIVNPGRLIQRDSIILTASTLEAMWARINFGSAGNLILEADPLNTQANSVLNFKVDGADVGCWESDGHLGIGNTVPGSRVHVSRTNANTNPLVLNLDESQATLSNESTGGNTFVRLSATLDDSDGDPHVVPWMAVLKDAQSPTHIAARVAFAVLEGVTVRVPLNLYSSGKTEVTSDLEVDGELQVGGSTGAKITAVNASSDTVPTSLSYATAHHAMCNTDTTVGNYAGTVADIADSGGTQRGAGGFAWVATKKTAASIDTDLEFYTRDGVNVRTPLRLKSTGGTEVTSDLKVLDGQTEFNDTVTSTNVQQTVTRIKLTSTGDIADGHGPALEFAIEDNAAVDNPIGQVVAVRNGADNSGKVVVRVADSGTFQNMLTVTTSDVIVDNAKFLTINNGTASPVGGNCTGSTIGRVYYESDIDTLHICDGTNWNAH